jgi:alkylation response protein AidB-like acyl-CoA dehydrogenase
MNTNTHERLPDGLRDWLQQQAPALNDGSSDDEALLPALATAGLFAIGVPQSMGGTGGSTGDAVEAIAAVAEHSLTAAFVFWGHRAFIEYLLASPNAALRERRLPALLAGKHAGATGLSNAMKFLCGIESLQIESSRTGEGWRLDGKLPWVTNLRKSGFVFAAAVSSREGEPPFVVALDGRHAGVSRTADLDLIAMRGSNTAALNIDGALIDASDVIAPDARDWLPRVRPGFLGLQCGLSIGLARAALAAAQARCNSARATLQDELDAVGDALAKQVVALLDGLAAQRFVSDAAALFRLRIALADTVQRAVQLELQASGGRAYLVDPQFGFARRLQESAFVPVITPSVTQLQGELRKRAQAQARAA